MVKKNMSRSTLLQADFWQSMRVRITLGVICIVGLILLLFGQLAINEQRERMLQQTKKYGSEMADFIAQISTEPLQKYSYYQLENYVTQLERGQLIAFCEIYDNENNPLGYSRKTANLDKEKAVDSSEILIFAATIGDNGNQLGHVELGVYLSSVLSRINQTSLYIAIAFCLQLVVIGGAVSVYIHKKLVSPILRLSRTTGTIAAGQFATSDQAFRRDEIGGLARSINEMSRTLEDSYRTLELKVEERTAALSVAKDEALRTNRHLEIVGAEVQALLDNSPVGILFVGADLTIHRGNLEVSRITGYAQADFLGKSLRMFHEDESGFRETAKLISSALEKTTLAPSTVRLRKRNGRIITCAIRGRLTILDGGSRGLALSIEDITTRLQMEEELLKIKKLESVGLLAGGIAHDFNNILVSIVGNISLVERLTGDDDKIAALLLEAKRASLKAKDLTVKLLTFAKGGEPLKVSESLIDSVRESSSFALSGSNVKCSYRFAEDLWPVEIDKGQINQVVQNLVLNADQAMPHGGTLTIHCRNRLLESGEVPGLGAGKYVEVEFADTGVGISSKNKELIFDPYFSTKERSSETGSGLGLSIVRSIISKHNGVILADSVPGKGSVFTLLLPAAAEAPMKSERRVNILPTGKGRVLVMDDEETIHTVLGEMLSYLGYECLHCYSGEETLRLYQQEKDAHTPIDVVIIDLTIPGGIGGVATIERLIAIDPSVKAIVSSGYADNPVLQNYREAGFVNIMPKPYQLLDLSRVMNETMNLE